jgi:hypothetical protein
MITVLTEKDYSTDPELRKAHTAWLNNIHTQRVLATMNAGTRAHNIKPEGPNTDDKLIAFGKAQGMQFVLDKIQSLDAPYRAAHQPDENFNTDPTK